MELVRVREGGGTYPVDLVEVHESWSGHHGYRGKKKIATSCLRKCNNKC